MEDYARCMVENVLKDAYVPIILDADALNLAAEYRELTGYFTENIIVTPHMKEMSRLTGIQIEEMKENPVRTAREFADQYGVVCVLKDAATVIAGRDGKTFVNGSGTPAMAKGGSGDVLTGVIAGLVALGLEESDAAALGVYVHGLAGEVAEKTLWSPRSVSRRDRRLPFGGIQRWNLTESTQRWISGVLKKIWRL